MTHYVTCLNCAVDKVTCPRRLAMQQALKGQHVTSVKFRCPDRKPFFSAGQRVSFAWKYWDSDGYDEYALPLDFHGTVIRERGSKFVVQVDAGKDASGEGIEASNVFRKNDALIVKVRPADMIAIDEPDRAVCSTCYYVAGHEERCYSDGYIPDWRPKGCIKPTETAHPQEEYVF